MERLKILVVDDEARMRKLVRDFLVRSGYDVIEAQDGGQALDIFFEKFSSRLNKRYLIYTKDLRKDKTITYLPIYMTLFL